MKDHLSRSKTVAAALTTQDSGCAVDADQQDYGNQAILQMMSSGDEQLREHIEAQIKAAFHRVGHGKNAATALNEDADSTREGRAKEVSSQLPLNVSALHNAVFMSKGSPNRDISTDRKPHSIKAPAWRKEHCKLLRAVYKAASAEQKGVIVLANTRGNNDSYKLVDFSKAATEADFSWTGAGDSKALIQAATGNSALWAVIFGDVDVGVKSEHRRGASDAVLGTPEMLTSAPRKLAEGAEEDTPTRLDQAVLAASRSAGKGSIASDQLKALQPNITGEHLSSAPVLRAVHTLVSEQSKKMTPKLFGLWLQNKDRDEALVKGLVDNVLVSATRSWTLSMLESPPGACGASLLEKMKDKLLNDDINQNTVPVLQEILGTRYGFTFTRSVSGTKNSVQWEEGALTRMWDVLKLLPPDQVERVATMVRVEQSSGVYGGYVKAVKQVQLGFTEEQLGRDDNTLGVSEIMVVDEVRSHPDRFDHALRHEIGHAVDRQTGIMASNGEKDAFGGWKLYQKKPVLNDMVKDAGEQELFTSSYKQAAEANEGTDRPTSVDKAMQAAVTGRTTWRDIESKILGEVSASFEKSTVKEIIESNEGGRHWVDPAPEAGDNIYGFQPSAGGWLRYSADARKTRSLSNHQFMSPSEWFAEGYAFYFDGQDKDKKYGSLVNDKDPTLKKWLDANIAEKDKP